MMPTFNFAVSICQDSSEEVVDFGDIMTAMGIPLRSGNVVVGGRFYDNEWRDYTTGDKMTFYGPAKMSSPHGGTFLTFGDWKSSSGRKWTPLPSHYVAGIICQKSLPGGTVHRSEEHATFKIFPF